MVLKHDSEAALLQASKQYDAALKEQDLEQLNSLVAESYTIHADGITLKACLTTLCILARTGMFARLSYASRLLLDAATANSACVADMADAYMLPVDSSTTPLYR